MKKWQGDVIFLHEVREGAADRSCGVQVAHLAGMPDAVVRRAGDILALLEKNALENGGQSPMEDLPLFTADPLQRQDDQSSADAGLMARLMAIHPDELTPKAAMEALHSLKEISDGVGWEGGGGGNSIPMQRNFDLAEALLCASRNRSSSPTDSWRHHRCRRNGLPSDYPALGRGAI